MNNIDFKEAARMFVSKHYPQFLSKTDRFWEMLNEIDFAKKFSEVSYPFHSGQGFGFAGEVDPELKNMVSAIAVIVIIQQNMDEKVSESKLKNTLETTCLNLEITPHLKTKIEEAIYDVLASASNEVILAEKSFQTIPERKENQGEYVVYVPDKENIGSKREIFSGNDLQEIFLARKEDCDIFVYLQSVQKRSINGEIVSVELDGIVFNLLVLFLKYKDAHLPYMKLYKKAWQNSMTYDDNFVPIDITYTLKSSVSLLRKAFNDIINFKIPRASAGGYTCKGSFSYCLVLKNSVDNWFTIKGA
jgi:hypothetical protein